MPRIIPAHAGFTARPYAIPYARGDHPRTRGVYPWPGGLRSPTAGSSPHTRGLHRAAAQAATAAGIIPAHAGFTRGKPRGHLGLTDHPRTRGVYVDWCTAPPSVLGSSPHTRGLLWVGKLCLSYWGIIPAHAGFTDIGGVGALLASDHPRTRGVYGGQ